MTDADILTLVKADVGLIVLNDAQTAFLSSCLSSAKAFIEREGVTLDLTDAEDVQLVEMYTAYLWRKRAVVGNTSFTDAMPRMLRYALNNRVLGGRENES